MGSAAHYVAVAVGLFFIYIGIINLLPVTPIPGFGHEESKIAFGRTAQFFKSALGLEVSSSMLRSVVGVMDVSSGSLAAFGRYPYRILATLELLFFLVMGISAELYLGGSFALSILPTIGCITVLWFHTDLKEGDTSTKKSKRN